MRLHSGSVLGTYQIAQHIGSGGMGEVYQAHDRKLDRDVAIKVLPEEFARDAERLARFQREAKLLAALNHPNIATIHGLDQAGETHYLVMELVPGETLRERISRAGAIPVEEALAIAKQIAEALEAAHGGEKTIIHRDLKPANVKVTPEGRVKVLDFGLAKAFAPEMASGDFSNSPTLSALPTMRGVIMGTAAYMSPEQARGKPITKATDIWALGAVLYEMLTGKPPFQGEDVTDILATVVKTEPDWSLLPAGTPAAIHRLLRRCLRKEKRQRLQDATDARIEIEEGIANPGAAAAPARDGLRGIPLRMAAPSAAALLIVAAGLGWMLKPAPVSHALNPARAQIALSAGDELSSAGINVALSEDGTRLAYVGIHEGVRQVFVRALDSLEAKAIPGTEGADNPFFSPDGQWVGFFAQGKMKKVPVDGGAPATICDVSSDGGASWGEDGVIVFSSALGTGILQISSEGGEPKRLTKVDDVKGEYSHRYPQILPGGKAVIFTALNGFGWDESRIELLRLDTGERRTLVRGGNTGRFLPTGQLVYYRSGSLLAVPFDLRHLEVTNNKPVTLAEGIRQNGGTVGAAYAVSPSGTLAYMPAPGGARQFDKRLVWVDRQGRIEPIAAPVRAYGQTAGDSALSPDGKLVAVDILAGTQELWIYDLARNALTRLTSDQGSRISPVWTPDGRRVAYRGNKAGIWNLYWRAADGSGSEERLLTSQRAHTPGSWTPDGNVLAFSEVGEQGYDLWTLPVQGERNPQLFLQTRFDESGPSFSPDGHWIAYTSNETGGPQVYVQPYPGPGRRWQISTDGGNAAQWNPNGRELFYRNGNRTMVADVTLSPSSFAAGRPRVLYDGPEGDVSPDGQRFLAVQSVESEQAPTQVNVVLNWFEDVKRRMAAGSK